MRLFKEYFRTCLVLIIPIQLFTGAVSAQFTDQPIKIGLLIPDSRSIAAKQGAEMAIREANENGGFNGRPFQLVVRSMEGPWGTGSKQAVNLIFEEKVWVLLGSHDGRNAHLVEQAATKSTVVFVSAWAGDPTLSQAFVPWFFNCVPNDLQQAASLIEEIYNKKKFNKVAVIHGNDYDSKMTLDNFLKSVKMSGKSVPLQFSFDDYNQKPDVLFNEINKADANCIVIFCQPSSSSEIVRQIRQREMKQPLYGSLSLLNEDELSAQEMQHFDNVLSIPSGDWSGSENHSFRQEYQKTYKKIPGVVASYSYDGMNILIEAIRKAGSSDREKIQKALSGIHHRGVTGLTEFDDKGNRKGSFKIMTTKDGTPVSPQ